MISAFNSLTLSPALTALLLRPRDKGARRRRCRGWRSSLVGGWLGWEFLPAVADRALAHGCGPADHDRRMLAVDRRALVGAIVGWHRWRGRSNRVLGWSFRAFNRAFDLTTDVYTWRRRAAAAGQRCWCCCVYGGLLYLTYFGFDDTPTGFIPAQDKGYLLVNVQLPDSASVERTEAGDAAASRSIARQDAGRQAHGGHRRAVDSARTPTRRTSARCT